MIQLYTSPSCASCRKVKKYFQKYNIPFKEKNIFNNKISKEDIFKMLANSENGFEDIISTRSKIFKEMDLDIDSMKMGELITFIVDNPSILKRPIILTDYEIQVGYNDDDITLFLPPELRDMDCLNCSKREEDCEYLNAIDFED